MKFHLWAIALIAAILAPLSGPKAADLPDDAELIAGFERIVFNAEIPGRFSNAGFVKKFAGPVRFRVENTARQDRRAEVEAFVRRIGRDVPGLETRMAEGHERADFIVHVVDQADYVSTARRVHRNPFMQVPRNFIVRASYGRRGIERSDAIIVSDRGERLFQRCLIEEILQGLGPLDDNPDAPFSVFNDTSTHTVLTRYDRIMMTMLYDPRLRPGTNLEAARPLLPVLARDARRATR